jgi:hypothetical protein
MYVFPCSSRAEIIYKQIKINANVVVAPRPVFHALSNGALVFGISHILCTGKWRKHFTETVLAFNLHFCS